MTWQSPKYAWLNYLTIPKVRLVKKEKEAMQRLWWNLWAILQLLTIFSPIPSIPFHSHVFDSSKASRSLFFKACNTLPGVCDCPQYVCVRMLVCMCVGPCSLWSLRKKLFRIHLFRIHLFRNCLFRNRMSFYFKASDQTASHWSEPTPWYLDERLTGRKKDRDEREREGGRG